MNLARVLGRAAAVAALTAAPLAASGPAQAATYDGQDPIATGCASSAITAESTPIYRGDLTQVGTIQLRYSTSCRTAWARIITPLSTGVAFVYRNTGGAEGCPGSGNALTWSSTLGDYTCYTPMLNDANVASYGWGVVDGWWGSSQGTTPSY
ncbi:uncharacterized protein DUF2690 [Streptomyces sp. 846.5]|nr:DUF2690 domain-containing protein [Streptomyces sp. 846.5]TDU04994.1 uncharacterized protein DUF2690 [Streptomyces sp. 846.5]